MCILFVLWQYLGADLEDVHGRTIHDDESCVTLPVLSLPGVVLLPGQMLPLFLFQPSIVAMIKQVLDRDRTFAYIAPGLAASLIIFRIMSSYYNTWYSVPTHPWKYSNFFLLNLRPWNLKVLENRTGVWRYLNFIPQVLESPWIHQLKLCDISNFVKQHLCRFSGSFNFWFCETYILAYFMLASCFLSTTRSFSLPGILPNTRFANSCHVLFLSTKTVP